jgi:hypothetical protein
MGDRNLELGSIKQGSNILGRTEAGMYEMQFGEGIFIACRIREENI